MSFSHVVDWIKRKPSQNTVYHRIADNHVDSPDHKQTTFKPGDGYFEVILKAMRLQNSREYWQGFLPFVVVETGFIYGGENVAAPVFVGNQLLESIRSLIDGQQVEYRNTSVIGPTPYVGGNVGLFTGLFRMEVDNIGRELFKVVEGVLGGLELASDGYAAIARSIGGGLESLLGMKEVEIRVGTRDEFSPANFQSGYLVYAREPKQGLEPGHLWLKEEQLLYGESLASAKRYVDSDWCLVEIRHHSERNDYQRLSFYRLWDDVQKVIWEEHDPRRAKRVIFPKMLGEIGVSRDLTRNDRVRLLQAFQVNLENDLELYDQSIGRNTATGTATRGSATWNTRARLQRAANIALKAGFSDAIQNSMLGVSEHLEGIVEPDGKARKVEVSDGSLRKQIRALKKFELEDLPDPAALAECLTVAAISDD